MSISAKPSTATGKAQFSVVLGHALLHRTSGNSSPSSTPLPEQDKPGVLVSPPSGLVQHVLQDCYMKCRFMWCEGAGPQVPGAGSENAGVVDRSTGLGGQEDGSVQVP